MKKLKIVGIIALGELSAAACGSDNRGENGADGADGADGASALIDSSEEKPGDKCTAGGTKIDYGTDLDGNGSLEKSEIEGTRYVCNGGDGAKGPKGDDGAQGPKGDDGEDGEMGEMGGRRSVQCVAA